MHWAKWGNTSSTNWQKSSLSLFAIWHLRKKEDGKGTDSSRVEHHLWFGTLLIPSHREEICLNLIWFLCPKLAYVQSWRGLVEDVRMQIGMPADGIQVVCQFTLFPVSSFHFYKSFLFLWHLPSSEEGDKYSISKLLLPNLLDWLCWAGAGDGCCRECDEMSMMQNLSYTLEDDDVHILQVTIPGCPGGILHACHQACLQEWLSRFASSPPFFPSCPSANVFRSSKLKDSVSKCKYVQIRNEDILLRRGVCPVCRAGLWREWRDPGLKWRKIDWNPLSHIT